MLRHTRLPFRGVIAVAVLGAAFSLHSAAPAGEAAAGLEVLSTSSRWRCHFTWKTEMVSKASGELAPAQVKVYVANKGKQMRPARTYRTDLPAEGWRTADFDDGGWGRSPGPLYTRGTRDLALICLRGKFTVKDPGALKGRKLNLSLVYRGGAVAYLNGKELARGHLPKGKIDLETPGERYPDKAYVSSKGVRLRWMGFGDPQKYKDRFALRNRKLEVTVPGSALRKGVNVLALEIHRAPTSEVFFTAKVKTDPAYSTWDMIGLEGAKLTAPAGSPVTPNVGRPRGLQVWNCPVLGSVHTIDFGDPHDKIRPIEISGARNGAFSGKVVVSCDGPIRGIKATASALKAKDGASIAASAIQVRYALLADHAQGCVEKYRGRRPNPYQAKGVLRFDGLAKEAPVEVPVRSVPPGPRMKAVPIGAVQPVWVTVRVPREAKPGQYAGKLAIAAGGAKTVEVPVLLKVADWALPDPKAFKTFLGVVQSPESVAMQYKVKMWSPEHWKLLEKSFELLGQLGSNDAYIMARAKTYYGNPHSMVRWIRKPGGKWGHDFSIAEKYLNLAVKHLGKIPVVGAYVWDVDAGSTYMGFSLDNKYGKKSHIADQGTPITVVDPKTGKLSIELAPKFSDPGAVEFWKPVYDGIRRILAKHSIEKSMAVSLCPDKRPERHVVKVLKTASGGAGWISHAHPPIKSIHGEPVPYTTTVWAAFGTPDPSEQRYYGWKREPIVGVHARLRTGTLGEGLRIDRALGLYHIAMDRAITSKSKLRGVGRLGADFWPVLKGKRGRSAPLVLRYALDWHGGDMRWSSTHILAAGKDCPLATGRSEMLRAGIQEAEARIFIEKALIDPAAKARLGSELAKRCQDVLDERTRFGNVAMKSNRGGGYLHFKWYEASGVGDRTARLYAAAAEVAGKLGSK